MLTVYLKFWPLHMTRYLSDYLIKVIECLLTETCLAICGCFLSKDVYKLTFKTLGFIKKQL